MLKKIIYLVVCISYIQNIIASDCYLADTPPGYYSGGHYHLPPQPRPVGYIRKPKEPKYNAPNISPAEWQRQWKEAETKEAERKRQYEANLQQIYSDTNFKFDKNSHEGRIILVQLQDLRDYESRCATGCGQKQYETVIQNKGKIVELFNASGDKLGNNENYVANKFLDYAIQYKNFPSLANYNSPRYNFRENIKFSSNSQQLFSIPSTVSLEKPEDYKYIETVNELAENAHVQTDVAYNLHANLALTRLNKFREQNNFKLFNMELNNIWNILGFSKGVVNSFALRFTENAYETAYAVSHPLESAQGLYYAIFHIPELSSQVYNHVIQTWEQMPHYSYEQRGEVFGKLAADCLSMYYGGVASKWLNSTRLMEHAAKAYEWQYHKIANEHGIIDHGPHNSHGGPLARIAANDEGMMVSETFWNSHYLQRDSRRWDDYYRVSGGKANSISAYWTREIPKSPNHITSRAALDPDWGNSLKIVTKIQAPPGVRSYEGKSAPTKVSRLPEGFPESEVIRHGDDIYIRGGGNQVYFDPKEVSPEQLKSWKVDEWEL